MGKDTKPLTPKPHPDDDLTGGGVTHLLVDAMPEEIAQALYRLKHEDTTRMPA